MADLGVERLALEPELHRLAGVVGVGQQEVRRVAVHDVGEDLEPEVALRIAELFGGRWNTQGRLQDDSAGDVAARLPIGLAATGDSTPRRRPSPNGGKGPLETRSRRRARNRPFHSRLSTK